MLWWFVGIWLASGAIVPASLLVKIAFTAWGRKAAGVDVATTTTTAASTAPRERRWRAPSRDMWPFGVSWQRAAGVESTARARRPVRYVVMGAIGIGVLVILLFGALGQSVRDQQVAATVAPAPPAEAADTTATGSGNSVAATLPEVEMATASTGGSAQAPSSTPPDHVEARVAASTTYRADVAAPQAPRATVPLIWPTYGPVLRAQRGGPHHHASEQAIRPHVSPSNRGTWLAAPNPNSGANS